MGKSYQRDTDIGKVRLIIADGASEEAADKDAAVFEDEDLQAFLDLEGAIKLAAAQALDSMASSEAMVMKRITLLELKTDGPAVAAALRAHAVLLRDQYSSGEDEDAGALFDWAEQDLTPWSAREIIIKAEQRL